MLFNQLAVILTIPWLAIKLSPFVFGQISTSLIIIQAGWVFVDWGLMNYATEVWQRGASKTIKNKFITNLITSRLILSVIYLTLIFCLIASGVIYIPYDYLPPLALTIVFGAVFPLWFFHVNKSPKELVLITLCSRLIFIALVIIFVRTDAHAPTYLYLHTISFMAITMLAYYKMFIKYSFIWQGFNFIKSINYIVQSTGFFLNSLTNSNVHVMWGFAVTITQEPIAIGLYNIAEQGYRAGSAISNTISQVSRLNTIKLDIHQTLKLIIFYGIAYTFAAIMGYLLASPIIKIFFQPIYFESVNILKILVGVWLVQSFIKLINYPLLGKLISVVSLHKMNPYIFFGYLSSFGVWSIFFGSLNSLVLTFFGASILHLCLFAIILFREINFNKG